MNIVIIGGGTVGQAICTALAKEGHSITVIDHSPTAISEISNTSDVIGIVGSAVDVLTMKKIDMNKVDLVCAVTCEDEINILACAAAKKLGARHTVARVRNPEYTDYVRLMRDDMNLSHIVNPELAAAKEISRMLRFPAATKVDTFCKGKVELVQVTINDEMQICGMSLNNIRSKLKYNFLICCVLRGDTVHIPSGNFTLENGDIVGIISTDDQMTMLFKELGIYKQSIKDVLIAGGGRITYYLQSALQKSRINSTVIEKDKDLCREIAEQYNTEVICDDATKQEVLLECGVDRADAFLSLGGIDEENAIMSMFAKTLGAKKVITLISQMSHIGFFQNAGLESIVSPRFSTAAFILRYVRGLASARYSGIESLHKIMDEKAEALEFSIKDDIDGITNVPLKDLKTNDNVIVACIIHDDKPIIPSGSDILSKGDTVIVVTSSQSMSNIKDIK